MDRERQRRNDNAGNYIYIDVWDCKPRLMFLQDKGTGGCFTEEIYQDSISEDEMIDTIEK